MTNGGTQIRESTRLANYTPSQRSRERASLRTIIGAKIWRVVNCSLYRYSPSYARGWRRYLVRLFGGTVSPKSSLSRKALIDCPWNFVIGDYSSIGDQSWVYALEKIKIWDKVCVGDSVKLLTGTHDITSKTFALVCKPINIASGSWVATCAIVLPGVSIGEGAVVGAGAVVYKDVAPWTVVAGNPAKFIKNRVVRV